VLLVLPWQQRRVHNDFLRVPPPLNNLPTGLRHGVRVALTPGEPAGVGPDIAVRLAQQAPACALVLIADPAMLEARARQLRLAFATREWNGRDAANPGVYVLPVRAARAVRPGQLDVANAPYVVETLTTAVAGCVRGEFDALVTGPVHKGLVFAKELAGGDLAARIDVDQKDEIGALAAALTDMVLLSKISRLYFRSLKQWNADQS